MEECRIQWREFIRENRFVPWISLAAVLLSYGAVLTGLRIGVDSEFNMNDPDALLSSWYSISQYSLVWLKTLFGMRLLNPFAENLVMMAVMVLCGITASFTFYVFSGRAAEMKGFCAVFPALFLTHPCYVEQYLFTLQAAEVAVCMLSCLAAAFCASRWAFGGKKSWGAAAVLLMAFGFGGYQALVPFYMAAALGIYLVYYEFHDGQAKGFYLRAALRHLTAFLIGYVLYMLVGRAVIFYQFGSGFQGGYLEGQILWSSHSASECIGVMKSYIRIVILGENEFFPGTFLPFALLFAVRLLFIWGKKRRREYLLYAAAALALVLSPFYLCFYQGREILIRSQMSLPFAAAFFGSSLVLFIAAFREKEGEKKSARISRLSRPAAGTAAAILFLFAVNQGNVSSRAVVTAQMTYENDKMTARQIAEGLKRLDASEAGTRIAMIGRYHPNLPRSASIREETIGYSIFEWDYQMPVGVSRRGAGFMQAHGLAYEAATEEEYARAKEYSASMPCWPAAGSMKRMGDIVIVKFSEE